MYTDFSGFSGRFCYFYVVASVPQVTSPIEIYMNGQILEIDSNLDRMVSSNK